MRESRFYSSKSQEAQRQLLEWNGEAQSQKATASALSGDCHQQFGLKEWLLMLKCLCAASLFSAWHCNTVILFVNLNFFYNVDAMTFDLMVGSNSVPFSKCQSDSRNNGGKRHFQFLIIWCKKKNNRVRHALHLQTGNFLFCFLPFSHITPQV